MKNVLATVTLIIIDGFSNEKSSERTNGKIIYIFSDWLRFVSFILEVPERMCTKKNENEFGSRCVIEKINGFLFIY